MTTVECQSAAEANSSLAHPSEDLKSRLIADLAHDLTNPVSNLRLRLYVLKNAPQRLTESLSVMDSLVDHLETLATELLTLSHLDSDALHVATTLEVRDLNPIVKKMVRCCTPLAESKQLALKVDTAPQALTAATAEKPIERAIVNLIANAISYTPSGGEVVVSTRRENDQVVVSVRDTGIGISPAALPHIFERFYRSKEVKGTIHGTGLGLTIVKEIVQKHGGRVQVSSDLGKGSVFEIWLPAATKSNEIVGE
jgi:signal transduction histidine kinase